jgi:hypothetical protein
MVSATGNSIVEWMDRMDKIEIKEAGGKRAL